jgi:hypothetical protein
MLKHLERLSRHTGRLFQRQYSSTPESLPSSVFLRSFMDSGKVGPVQQQIEAKVLVNVEITLHQ